MAGQEYFGIRIDTKKLEQDAERAKQVFDKIGMNVEVQGKRIDDTFSRIGKSAALIGAGFSANELVTQITQVRGQFQQLEVAFNTMLRSEEKASQLMSQLVRTAATTPFDLQSVSQGAKQLLAYGESVENVNSDLIMLGNIAAGLSVPLGDLVYLYGTTMTKGRLYTEDFNQFVGRGIPLIGELAKQFGVAENEVKGLVEAGRVGFPEIQKALQNLTGEGGMFFNLMEKQSKTITGQISNIEDSFSMMFNEIGKANEGIINDALSGVSYLLENYKTIGKTLVEIAVAYGTYRAALVAVTALQKAHAAVLAQSVVEQRLAAASGIQLSNAQAIAAARTKLLTSSVKSLNASLMVNPYTLITAAVVALGYGLYKVITYQTDYEKGLERLNNSISEFDASVISEQRELSRLKGQLQGAKKGTDEYNDAKNKIIKNYGKYYEGLENEIEKVGLTEQAYNKLTDAINKSFGARQYNKFKEEQQSELDSIVSENLEYIQSRLYDSLGDELGSYIYTKIRQALVEGEDIDKEVTELLNQIQDKGTIIADSRIDSAINKIQNAYNAFDILDKKAKERFGITDGVFGDEEQVQTTGKKTFKTITEVTNAISKLEKKLSDLRSKSQKGLIGTGDIDTVEAELDSLKKKYKAMTGEDWQDEKKYNDVAKSYQKIEDLEKESLLRRLNTVKELQNDIAQAKIDAIIDEGEKTKQQIEYNNKQEIEAIKQRRDEYVREEIEAQKKIFEATEEYLSKKVSGYKIKSFDEKSVSVDTSAFDNLIQIIQDNQKNKQLEAERKAMQNYLAEYGEYWKKRKAIFDKYQEQISKATTEGEKLSLQSERTKVLANLDDEAKKKTSIITKLFGDMAKKSVAEMRKIADEAEQMLAFIEGGQYQKDNAFGITEEQFKVLSQSPDKLESIKNEIANVRNEADKAEPTFERIKSLLSEIFKTGGSEKNNLSSLLNELNGQINNVMQSVSFLSDTFSSLGDAFGSDVLSGIGEGLNVATSAVKSAMQGAQAGSIFGGIGAAAGAAIGVVSSLATSIAQIHDKKNEKRIQKLQDQIDVLTESYDDLGKSIEKAYSKDASKLINQQNELLKQQKILIQQQIREEEDKKKTDEARIKEWKQQIDDINEQLEENKQKAIDAIFGEDVQSAIERFATSFTDAWAQGTDATESARDAVRQMMQQMVTESIKAAIQASSKMEDIRKKLQEFYADNILTGWEQDYIYNMAEQLQKELDAQFGWAENLFQDKSTTQQASAGGFTTMSQDSADELNGRFTALYEVGLRVENQINIGNVNLEAARNAAEQMRDITQNCYLELVEIRENTGAVVKPIQQMQKDMSEMKNVIKERL